MNENDMRSPTTSPSSTIQSYLERYEWEYEVINPETIITGFSTDDSTFTMFIRCVDNIAYFSIPNFADPPLDQCTLKTYRCLLEANYHMILGKFAIDENGKIGLFIEIPLAFLSYNFFSLILYIIGINAKNHIPSISEISKKP